MSQQARTRQRYDHRLKHLVRSTGDIQVAVERGVPRSTARDWVRSPDAEILSFDLASMSVDELRAEVVALRHRNERLVAILGLLVALMKALGVSLRGRRVADGAKKALLLRAVEKARGVLGLRSSLRVLRLSSSRYHDWAREERCALDDVPSCPHVSPQQLTLEERQEMKEMATSRAYRHVSTGTLAILAQRLGKVFASASTWYRFIRRYGWRRPRRRVHPKNPTLGVRASKPNEIWHIDTTVIRLLNGARIYLHAVIDNFSRRIVAWKVSDVISAKNTLAVLVEASRQVDPDGCPTLFADGGSENVNELVDELIESGTLNRVLAQTEISYSNSLIEAWWRTLKNQWLYLNSLDSLEAVRRLVEFFVREYNSVLPHSAFRGPTPDEMYFGTGRLVPEELEVAKRAARQARMEANRSASCATCG